MKKGFTLIELLVVIAIIGLLSSIVLVATSTARNKGNDASIKANLIGLRNQVSIYYTANGNLGTVTVPATKSAAACSTASTVFDPAAAITVNNGIVAAENVSDPSATWVATCALGKVSGEVNATSWAVSIPLRTIAGSWCVDSNGASQIGVASGGGASTPATCI